MKWSSTLSSKGQLTLPLEIRTHLGLKTGDRVEFVAEDGRIIIRPLRSGDNPFKAYVGVLGTFPGGQDEINAWIRDLRDEDSPRR